MSNPNHRLSVAGKSPMPRECPLTADATPTVIEPSDGPTHTIMGLPLPRPGPLLAAPRRAPRSLEGTELLARYEVEGVIGEGGMATVYRGRHKTIQKAVAIKVLDGTLEFKLDAAERFLQEAQITSRVVHENVVEVTDFGTTADGVVFCVMELLLGETVADLIDKGGPLSLPRAAGIMLQICAALEAAHGHGIIHRDLKPANCFRTPRPSNSDFVKLLDFGIARVTHDEEAPRDPEAARPRRTQVGFIIGTPDYMAPEQAREEPFDHRVDVYAAGGLFFELLTGRTPYLGTSVASLLAAHLHEPVPDPGEIDPSLSPAVRRIVQTAMAKRADDRYPSMAAMAAAIEDALRPAPPEVAAVRRRLRRHSAAVVSASALLFAYWLVGQPPVATSHAASTPTATVAAELPAAAIAPEPATIVVDAPSLPVPTLAPEPLLERVAAAAVVSPPLPGPRPSQRKPAQPSAKKRVTPPPAAIPEPEHFKLSEVKDPFATATPDAPADRAPEAPVL